ncbi:MAG: PAS domain S-box protein [Mariprofundaceae bacterium]|nr:PAS domain S-box protein [Mariprofundaceae bacterium]
MNPTDNELNWSGEVYRIFEVDMDSFDVSYEAFLTCIHPEDRQAVDSAYRKSLETRQPYSIEHRLLFPDGRIKWVHEQCESTFTGDGTPLRSLGTVQDITERKQAEHALQESNARLVDVFETMSDGFVAFDAKMNYAYVNANAGGVLGRKPAELIGKNYWQEYPEAKGTPFADAYERSLKTRAAIIFEDYYEPFDRWFENRIYPSKDGLSVFFTEITERKKAEEALVASEARLNSIFHASFDAIVVHQDFQIVFANDAALKLCGIDSLEAILQMSVLDLVAPDYRAFARKIVQRVINSDKAAPAREMEALPVSGNAFPIEISSSLVCWGSGKAVVSIVRDISERKQTEKELEKHRNHLEELVDTRTHDLAEANKHLQDLDRLKSMFIASMSHELRTPMNSILGFTDLMLQGLTGEINAVQRDQLQRVHAAGKHLLMLITDIIDLS